MKLTFREFILKQISSAEIINNLMKDPEVKRVQVLSTASVGNCPLRNPSKKGPIVFDLGIGWLFELYSESKAVIFTYEANVIYNVDMRVKVNDIEQAKRVIKDSYQIFLKEYDKRTFASASEHTLPKFSEVYADGDEKYILSYWKYERNE